VDVNRNAGFQEAGPDLPAAPLTPRSRHADLVRGRMLILLAAVLWSTSGAFTKMLRQDTGFGLNDPPVAPLQIAFYRVLFAGLVLVPLLRRGDLSFRPALVGTGVCFAVMNGLFVWALAMGSAANAIFLQYTAPLWMYLICVWGLGEPADRRGAVALGIGMLGVGLIVWDGWVRESPLVIAVALGSGVAYAGVLVGLRIQRGASARWLTVFNHLFSAVVLIPLVWGVPTPSGAQMLVLVLYGALQMGLPYWLMAQALRSASPQEAGTLTLLEPLLNPLWAFLVSPATETPSVSTLAGGAFILAAVGYRLSSKR
jgi:drug/metabolite transporter (DMT)-like permease